MPNATCSRVHDGRSSSRVEHLDEVVLHENHRRELVVGVHLELRVIAAREAVVAAVRAAAIGVERPVERHPLDAVQRRTAGHFLIARLVGAALGLGQRGGAAVLDGIRDVAGGRLRLTRPRSKSRGKADIRFFFAT